MRNHFFLPFVFLGLFYSSYINAMNLGNTEITVNHTKSLRRGVPCFSHNGIIYPAIGSKEGRRVVAIHKAYQQGKEIEDAIKIFAPGLLHQKVESILEQSKDKSLPLVLVEVNRVNDARAAKGFSCGEGCCKTHQDFFNKHNY